MLLDFAKHPEAADHVAEFCVIGAGAAGVTIARRLMRTGREVVLLESGGTDFEAATQELYRGRNIGMPYYGLDEARLRFFGGTVSIWGGRAALFDTIDFETRDWVPGSGWPFGRDELLPWYREAHADFELGEFDYGDEHAWATLGVADPGFDPARIATRLWRFDEATERFAASRARDLIAAPNVRVLTHANVVRLHAGAEANRIDSVEIAALGGATRRVRAKHFVLACGAIENARLLLVSNDVEPGGIANAHDQVGRFFMEHPTGRIVRIDTPEPFALWAAFQKRFMKAGPPLAPLLRLSDAVQRERQALNSIVTFKLQRDPKKGVALGNKLYHNLKHSLAPNRRGRALDHMYRGVRAWFSRTVREPIEAARARYAGASVYLIARGEQAPNPASRVVLSERHDALGHRRADLDWQLSELDKHTARVFADEFGRELARMGKGGVTPSEWLAEPGHAWPVDPTVGNHPIAGYHHIGGTRMSDDPKRGVVDAECRVHGYANLHVAGSSTFATAGWANPTLTLVALAIRLAERLKTLG
ncbi:MAG TPA: GMC family oxidoreductase [Novosphingobium sp.]|nr:GMC family oxidoreductase [Novosphingobium sp.]